MLVMKFGGTSVGDAERMARACREVERRRARQPLVVVSALAGVTDALDAAAAAAVQDDPEVVQRHVARVDRLHRWCLSGIVEDASLRHRLDLELDRTLEDLRQLLRAIRVLGELTPRARDAILAVGEASSSRLFAAALQARGVPARWFDAVEIVATDSQHGAARVDLDETRRRLEEIVTPELRRNQIPVLGGFVGQSPSGAVTTLGRGGGDTTAAAVGAALRAEEVQIWTDVDGLMTGDPREVNGARPLRQISMAEAAAMAHHGAKVLHAPALEPALRCELKVQVRNTLRPEESGTQVTREPAPGAPPLAAVVSVGAVRLVMGPEKQPAAESAWAPVFSLQAPLGAVRLYRYLGGGPAEGGGPGSLALVGVVGWAIGRSSEVRREVLAAAAEEAPVQLAVAPDGQAVTLVVPGERRREVVRRLHRRFFEGGALGAES